MIDVDLAGVFANSNEIMPPGACEVTNGCDSIFMMNNKMIVDRNIGQKSFGS
jgi:hypothetical protein